MIVSLLDIGMPQTKIQSGRNDRRKGPINFFRRLFYPIFEWLFDNDLNTLEKILITYQIGSAIAIELLKSRLIAPPSADWNVLIPKAPEWAWMALIIAGSLWQLWGRQKQDICFRRNGAVCSMFIAGGLLGPLWIKAIGFGCIAAVILIFQIVVSCKFWKLCESSSCSNNKPCD